MEKDISLHITRMRLQQIEKILQEFLHIDEDVADALTQELDELINNLQTCSQ